jgi:type II secretory pathway component PulK
MTGISLRRHRRSHRRRGTILVVVLLIIAALAGMVLVLGRSARVEAMASVNHVAGARASAVENAAEQYVIALLVQDRENVLTLGESYFEAVPVGDAGAFWIVRPDYADSSLPVYGLVDESSKINLTTATREMLYAFPSMPQELPDSVFDWKDTDSEVEGDGAEDEYYMALPTPYRCKNGNFETVEELLLVRGAYPELLYGEPGYGVFASSAAAPGAGGGGMQIGGMSEQDLRQRGLYHYFTVYSREPATGGQQARTGRINVNTATREVLRCLPGLTDAETSSLVTRRGTSSFGQTDTSWVQSVLGDKAGPVMPLITGQAYQFSADIVAASRDGRGYRRVRIVVDASNATARPRIVYRSDLTDRGWPLDPAILDAMRAGSWTPTGTALGGFGGGGGRTSSSSAR